MEWQFLLSDFKSNYLMIIGKSTGQLNAPVSTMMRSPPPFVTTSTSIRHVVDLMLAKGYPMVIIVKYADSSYDTSYSSRAIGVFTAQQLRKLITAPPVSDLRWPELAIFRHK